MFSYNKRASRLKKELLNVVISKDAVVIRGKVHKTKKHPNYTRIYKSKGSSKIFVLPKDIDFASFDWNSAFIGYSKTFKIYELKLGDLPFLEISKLKASNYNLKPIPLWITKVIEEIESWIQKIESKLSFLRAIDKRELIRNQIQDVFKNMDDTHDGALLFKPLIIEFQRNKYLIHGK
ncbi:hypothetical protein [Desertivirga xinjiangensis]|uniref:hypothetical protein n=1 Tax=Desertivirga xinjiangensis TaxID=539206 RepID=UPI00210E6B93|nr:hypothetical protein [Pedobacter xinjiangensis]